MYALFIILNDLSRLDDIMQIFYEVGVGATSLDSTGMGKILLEHNEDIPIFSSIRKLVEGDQPYNKTLISVIREKKHLREVIDQVNELLDFSKEPGTGFMFVVPVLECYGSKIEDTQKHQEEN